MVAIVVGKFSQRHVCVPTSPVFHNACSKHVLERLNRPLTPPVLLRVISSAEVQSRTQLLMKRLPEPGSKTNISVRHDRDRNSMSRYYLSHIYLHQPLCRRALTKSKEVSTLRQTIHNHPNCINTPRGPRQFGDEVHRNMFPLPLGNL